MNEEKYTQLLEDGELFSYIKNLQQRIDKSHTLAMDLFRTIYDRRYSSFGQSREQYKDKFYELLKTLKGE